jgi:hypothetical protein
VINLTLETSKYRKAGQLFRAVLKLSGAPAVSSDNPAIPEDL